MLRLSIFPQGNRSAMTAISVSKEANLPALLSASAKALGSQETHICLETGARVADIALIRDGDVLMLASPPIESKGLPPSSLTAKLTAAQTTQNPPAESRTRPTAEYPPSDTKPTKTSEPNPHESQQPLWKVAWRFGLNVRAEATNDSPSVGTLRHGFLLTQLDKKDLWIRHNMGWTLIENRNTSRTLLRRVDQDDLVIMDLMNSFLLTKSELDRLQKTAIAVTNARRDMIKARMGFAKQAAVCGSHSKSTSKAVASVQSYYLTQAELNEMEKKSVDAFIKAFVHPLSDLQVEAKSILKTMVPFRKAESNMESADDNLRFCAHQRHRQGLEERYLDCRKKYEFKRDQLEAALRSYLKKKNVMLCEDLGAMGDKTRAIAEEMREKLLKKVKISKAAELIKERSAKVDVKDSAPANAANSTNIDSPKPERAYI
ncbi:hypothetical protein AAMO2058_000949300 [Amorphochlora amoebiformis]